MRQYKSSEKSERNEVVFECDDDDDDDDDEGKRRQGGSLYK